jgi:2-polyprenyl-3-methyl-5-hydroxy-6-metoxy-1,4-benzoquinol methylase
MTSRLDRSGLAAITDLQDKTWNDLFCKLEREQDAFLRKESIFRSAGYKWPRDPLHTWSRIWEYPYVYHHIQRSLNGYALRRLRALDLGSGVTFFPFSVARLGIPVICVDTDPIVDRDLRLASSAVDHAPGEITFRLTDGRHLPLGDGEVDLVYCISVLEHVPDPSAVVDEIVRVLGPAGVLILTIDLDLRGDQQISIEGRRRLVERLMADFKLIAPDRSVHPADLLRSDRGAYLARPDRSCRAVVWSLYHCLRRAEFRRVKALFRIPFVLAVEGMVLGKK